MRRADGSGHADRACPGCLLGARPVGAGAGPGAWAAQRPGPCCSCGFSATVFPLMALWKAGHTMAAASVLACDCGTLTLAWPQPAPDGCWPARAAGGSPGTEIDRALTQAPGPRIAGAGARRNGGSPTWTKTRTSLSPKPKPSPVIPGEGWLGSGRLGCSGERLGGQSAFGDLRLHRLLQLLEGTDLDLAHPLAADAVLGTGPRASSARRPGGARR